MSEAGWAIGGRIWTPEEDAAIRAEYPTIPEVATLAARLERSVKAISSRASSLGVARDPAVLAEHLNANRNQRVWTPEQDALLARLWGTMPVEEIAARLSRSVKAVQMRRYVKAGSEASPHVAARPSPAMVNSRQDPPVMHVSQAPLSAYQTVTITRDLTPPAIHDALAAMQAAAGAVSAAVLAEAERAAAATAELNQLRDTIGRMRTDAAALWQVLGAEPVVSAPAPDPAELAEVRQERDEAREEVSRLAHQLSRVHDELDASGKERAALTEALERARTGAAPATVPSGEVERLRRHNEELHATLNGLRAEASQLRSALSEATDTIARLRVTRPAPAPAGPVPPVNQQIERLQVMLASQRGALSVTRAMRYLGIKHEMAYLREMDNEADNALRLVDPELARPRAVPS